MNKWAFIRNCHGDEMSEYLAFAKYSGWGKTIQIGTDFNCIKQCKFQSTL